MEAIKSFTSGQDTFVILPTGYGKSIIYIVKIKNFNTGLGRQESIAVVVTPLTALMFDQKRRFSSMDINS